MRSDDLTATARIRDAAVEQFGEHGFDVGLRVIAKAAGVSAALVIHHFGEHGFDVGLRVIAKSAGVSAALVIHHFGSKEGLRKACDVFVAESIRSSKSEYIQSSDPASWLAQLADIESFAPLMAYLVRSMQSGGDLAKMLWRNMIDNAEQYLEEGVLAGTVKASRDPKARAKFLALAGGGSFLLYLQMHDNPGDMRAVLHDYAADMVLPSLEVYTQGLLTDSTMYDAIAQANSLATSTEE